MINASQRPRAVASLLRLDGADPMLISSVADLSLRVMRMEVRIAASDDAEMRAAEIEEREESLADAAACRSVLLFPGRTAS